MVIKIDEEIDVEKWRYFLDKNPYKSPFQSPECVSFFGSVNSVKVHVHAVFDNEEIVALAVLSIQSEPGVKKYFSRRAIIYGGPLLTDFDSALVLFEHLRVYYKRKVIYIETRNFFDYEKYKQHFVQIGWDYTPWLNYHLLTDEEVAMRKRMSSSRLRQVKKGMKNGTSWRKATSLDEVKRFYEILLDLYTSKVKKPLPNWDFFERFYESDMGLYLIVEYEGQVIGGIMAPVLEGESIYEWYIAGQDKQYKNQYPSVLATYSAMDYAIRNGLKYFDFMGGGPADEEYGVRDFKARFGGEEKENGRFRMALSPGLYKLGKIAVFLFSKLK